MITLNSGHCIPALGLWTWKSEPKELYDAVKHAIKLWYRHIDCAWIYRNEEPIGEAISDAISEGIVTREELFITSKLWNSAHHQDDVKAACKESLEKLQLDYLDLYLIHWPVANKRGEMFPQTPWDFVAIEELPYIDTWKAMENLSQEGLCKSVWVSNMSMKHLEKLLWECTIVPAMNQIEMHPFLPQDDLVKYCTEKWIVTTAYSPLWSMDRPAHFKGDNEPILIKHPKILEIADKYSTTAGSILIAWALNRGTCVIPKSTNFERLEANFNAADLKISNDDINVISALDINFRFITGKAFCETWSPYTQEYLWG